MERNILNTNQHYFTIDGDKKTKKVTIKTIESADDASFLTDDQSLVLKISSDGEHLVKQYISHFPLSGESSRIATIDQTFSDFDELIIAVHAENKMLSGDINFNLIVNFEYQ